MDLLVFSTLLQILCVGLILIACLNDIATRTVSDKLVVLLAVTGVAIHLVDGQLIGSLSAGTAIFFVAAWCWRRNWMGGGDVKLLGAATLGIPPGSVLTFVEAVAVAGGLLAILYLMVRPFVGASLSARPVGLFARAVRAERWRIRRGAPLPYACAIAIGVLFVIISEGVL